MFASLLKRITDYWKPGIKPIEISILSVDKIQDTEFKTLFVAKFRLGSPAGRDMYFNTTGTFRTDSVIDLQTLTGILETTDVDKYVKLNMKNRSKGDFNYEYLHNNNSLTINFDVF
jgi:hypothetical protein